jgi:hypothetical protein
VRYRGRRHGSDLDCKRGLIIGGTVVVYLDVRKITNGVTGKNTIFLGLSHSLDPQTSVILQKYQMVFHFVPVQRRSYQLYHTKMSVIF